MIAIKKLLLVLTIIFACSICVCAHPGSLDENGGHYNKSTGEYHYHHGFPEHQHPNGECPYNFVDVRNVDSSSSGGNSSAKTTKTLTLELLDACYIPFWLLLSLFVFSHFYENIDSTKNNFIGCLLSLLFIVYLLPPVLFASALSELILGYHNELVVVIIIAIISNLFFKFNYTNKSTIIFGVLAIISAYVPSILIGNNSYNTSIIICSIVSYVVIVLFFKLKKHVSSCVQPTQSNINKYQ